MRPGQIKTANFPTRDPSNPRVARGEIQDLSPPTRNAHECALAGVFARLAREPFACWSAEIPRLRSAKKHSRKNAGPEGTRLARDWSGRRMCCAELRSVGRNGPVARPPAAAKNQKSSQLELFQSLARSEETAVGPNSTPQQ